MKPHRPSIPAATIALLAAIAVLQGCAPVGPNYRKPFIETPDAWHESVSRDIAGKSNASLQTWWNVFDDPLLDDLIERARLSNLDVQIAVSRVGESRARLAMAAGKKLPRVDAGASASLTEMSDDGELEQIAPPAGFEPQALYGIGVSSVWEIDVFGRIRRSIEAAGAGYQASVEDYRDVLVTLLSEVALAYVDVRKFQQSIVIAQANVGDQRRSLALAQDRFDSGVSSKLDVAQARSNLADTEASIPLMKIGLNRALNRLAVLLGEDAGSLQAEFAEPKPIPLPKQGIGIGVPADVLRQRPDVRAAERQLAAQTASIGVATADLYPRFGLSGFIGFESRNVGSLIGSSGLTWGVGLPIQWNIFSGGRVRSNIVVHEELAQQALLVYRNTVLLALEEVENAIVGRDQQSIRGDRLREAVAATREAVDLVTVQYETGLTDFNNVLDMQRILFQQQGALVSTRARAVQELVSLYKALGGGWEFDATEADPAGGTAAETPTVR